MKHTGVTFHMTMNDFRDAMIEAAPGTAIVYATGDLAFERAAHRISIASELDQLAKMVYAHHERGDVCLTQKRVKENVFEYRATKCAEPLSCRSARSRRL